MTPELITHAAQLVSAGNYIATVCKYLDIDESTWYRWMQKGQRQKEGLFYEFYKDIKKAEAAAEMRAVTGIVAAGKVSWQALAWYLERKYPKRWGKREQIDLDGKDILGKLATALEKSIKER